MTNTERFAIAGAAFGLSFPIIGTAVDAGFRFGDLGFGALVDAQASNPLLWIIDSAPIWLGVFAALAGRRQDRLVAVYQDLERANEQRLRTIPAGLRAARDELSPAVSSLAELTQGLTSVVQKQASSIAEASTTMHEIRQTSAAAASRAERVLQVAARADELSEEGRSAVESSIRGLQEIRVQIDAIVGRISDLSERALRVGEIIESVKDIAEQSNVLALNAAIEAAKAGEFGRGFGVVAREIRSLADQSIGSTRRIREILGEIQSAIHSTASMTDAGKNRMDKALAEITSSGESLRQMTGMVKESGEAARQIAESVRQQHAGTTQMLAAIDELHGVMEATVTGIKDAEQSAQNLHSIADRMSEMISVFDGRTLGGRSG